MGVPGPAEQRRRGKATELLLTQFSAVTDEKGDFQIKGVPAETYTLVYRIWTQNVQKDTEIRFESWSF